MPFQLDLHTFLNVRGVFRVWTLSSTFCCHLCYSLNRSPVKIGFIAGDKVDKFGRSATIFSIPEVRFLVTTSVKTLLAVTATVCDCKLVRKCLT